MVQTDPRRCDELEERRSEDQRDRILELCQRQLEGVGQEDKVQDLNSNVLGVPSLDRPGQAEKHASCWSQDEAHTCRGSSSSGIGSMDVDREASVEDAA